MVQTGVWARLQASRHCSVGLILVQPSIRRDLLLSICFWETPEDAEAHVELRSQFSRDRSASARHSSFRTRQLDKWPEWPRVLMHGGGVCAEASGDPMSGDIARAALHDLLRAAKWMDRAEVRKWVNSAGVKYWLEAGWLAGTVLQPSGRVN